MMRESRRFVPEKTPDVAEQKEEQVELLAGFAEARESSSDTELVAAVEKLLADPEAYIDKGGAGAVYRLSEHNVCIKVFHPHKDTERRNTKVNIMAREAGMTEIVARHPYAGVRTPRCLGYFVIENADGRSALILEELNAVNLNHVLEGKAPAPENFDWETFMDALYEYIDNLHEKAEILHGDLYARNIMIDKETGAPYVIDFGEAKNLRKLSKEEQERRKNAEFALLDEIYDKFENA
ncbi:serine/threonine protein kinase [Patescibacteria group bacterium]|nr:serine/threonine protein kinase [Patescibacteria group bacterium]